MRLVAEEDSCVPDSARHLPLADVSSRLLVVLIVVHGSAPGLASCVPEPLRAPQPLATQCMGASSGPCIHRARPGPDKAAGYYRNLSCAGARNDDLGNKRRLARRPC